MRCSQCHIINRPPVELKLTLLFCQTRRSRLVMELGVVYHTAIFSGRTRISTLATWNCSFRRNMLTCLMFRSIRPFPVYPISEPSPTKPRRSGTPFSYLLSNEGYNSFSPIYCPIGVIFWDGRFEGDVDHAFVYFWATIFYRAVTCFRVDSVPHYLTSVQYCDEK